MSYLEGLPPAKRAALLRLGSAGAQAPPPPAAASGLEGARQARELAQLRAAVRSQAAESVSLRRNLSTLVQQNKQLDHELQGLRHTSHTRERRAEERHAAEMAELEEQRRRQRRALLDLAGAAEALARENADLHQRLVSLQDENEDSSRSQEAMRERLGRLQAVCLSLEGQQTLGSSPGGVGAAAGCGQVPPRQADVLECLSSTLRALTPANGANPQLQHAEAHRLPPALARDKVGAAARGLPTDLRLALRELEALRREREGLAARLKATEGQALKVQEERRELQQSLARERVDALAATADLQRQLKASRDRVAGMARRCKEKEAALQERDAFVAKLERRLLQRCRQASGSGAGGDGGSSRGGSRAASPLARHTTQRECAACPVADAAGGGGAEWERSPGGQSLAALSPNPYSPFWEQREQQQQGQQGGSQWQWEQQQEEDALESDLRQMLHADEGRAAGECQGGQWGGQEAGCPDASPADSTIPAYTPREELAPRRLRWAADAALVQKADARQRRDAEEDQEWLAYQLGSPSPGGVGAGPGWPPAQEHAQTGSQEAPGGLNSSSSNPLFSFHPKPAAAAEGAPGEQGQAQQGAGWRRNDVFSSPGAKSSLPAQQGQDQQQQGQQQQQQRRQPGYSGEAARGRPQQPPAAPRTSQQAQQAAAQMLPRMPSVEFPSLSALLEALTPGAQPALGAPAAELAVDIAATTMTPRIAAADMGGQQPLLSACATQDSIERKLSAAVACFFAETAEKAPAERPAGQLAAEVAGPAAKQQQQQQQQQQRRRSSGGTSYAAGAAGRASGPAPALKHGRINRAADQKARQPGAGAAPRRQS